MSEADHDCDTCRYGDTACEECKPGFSRWEAGEAEQIAALKAEVVKVKKLQRAQQEALAEALGTKREDSMWDQAHDLYRQLCTANLETVAREHNLVALRAEVAKAEAERDEARLRREETIAMCDQLQIERERAEARLAACEAALGARPAPAMRRS